MNMKKLITTAFIAAACSTQAANPEPVIYGTLVKANGQEVTGTIRWGDQETFLSDIFNGKKTATVGWDILTDDQQDEVESLQPGPKANIGDLQITFKSFFGKEVEPPFYNVPFGAIQRIDVDNKNDTFTATLHDGTQIIITESTNDLTDEINVLTPEGQTSEYDLDDLTAVVFSKAPERYSTFGEGIYGVVTSDLGTFSGRIMWDKDERLTSEELDGSENGEDYEIKFTDIRSIEKQGNASKVVLRDNKELLLTGTNDVNNGNRGIWIDHPDLGRIEVHWSQFKKLVIQEVDVNWMDFDDYKNTTRPLSAQVTLEDGQSWLSKPLIFDLNQQSSAEMLYVEVDKANRQIPLHTIKSMQRLNDHSVELTFKDGSKKIAYGNRSVSFESNGLITNEDGKQQWTRWLDVKSLSFE